MDGKAHTALLTMLVRECHPMSKEDRKRTHNVIWSITHTLPSGDVQELLKYLE